MGKRVLLDKDNVTRLVQRLEDERLVRRVPCLADGRGVIACITPEGRKLRSKMWHVYERAVKEHFLSKPAEKYIAQLNALIRRIRADSAS